MGDEERQPCRAALAKMRPQTPPHLCAKEYRPSHSCLCPTPFALLQEINSAWELQCEGHGEGYKNPANFHSLIDQFDKYFPSFLRE